MLFRNLDLLFSNPTAFFILIASLAAALVVAITIHEFSHALAARTLGDTTAERLGRLSLNPARHLDPAGTLLLLVAGFGWGKPVPVDPRLMRGNPRTSMSLVSLAGPASNILTAVVLGSLFRFAVLPEPNGSAAVFGRDPLSMVAYVVSLAVLFSVILAVFNMIPLWPLDGFKVLLGILPEEQAQSLAKVQMHGPLILMGVVFADIALGLGILNTILGPPIDILISAFMG
ncbi:MAG: Zn-dependent protease (includes SpoIVFB) [Chloroflexi bacterium]|jgi:Zn-dependent protease|nr:MAG: Zn-dependent protease (includes SpoIVFB) [Chloroflexota bacterium]